jgi:O-acetyl-ADP-ribose deacetylase (regulator of RNase III)
MNAVVTERTLPTGQTVQIVEGDLTVEPADALVNAANPQLKHGGGVAAAMVTRGGEIIQIESDEWVRQHGPVTHSQPARTSAGLLPAKYVIHAVGPVWGDGDEEAKLADAVSGALRAADGLRIHSLAMPAISTGIFGFPVERGAAIILSTIERYFKENTRSSVKLVKLVLLDEATVQVFIAAWGGPTAKK